MAESNSSSRNPSLTIAAGYRFKFAILAVWTVILAITLPLAANLDTALRDDPISYLPRSAESTQVATLMKVFPAGAVSPAIVVFARETGLTQSDRGWIKQFQANLNHEPPTATQPIDTPKFSQDGKASFLVAPIKALEQSAVLVKAVQELRQRTITAPTGLNVKVSGPAGNRADLETVFDSIQGTTFLATAGLILLLLVLIYRSPIFWFIPFIVAICTDFVARGLIYLAAISGLIVNDQSANILPVFVFGAGTDFALLLVARYREELHRYANCHQAMAIALQQTAPAIIASAMTTIVALIALLLAELNGISGLAAVAAIGIGVAMVAMLTLLPALLLLVGRTAFFPFIPRYHQSSEQARQGIWWRIGAAIARHPRPYWMSSIVLLLIMCLGLTGFDTGLNRVNSYLSEVEAVQGMELIYQSFPQGVNAPGTVIVQDRSRTEAVRSVLQSSSEIAEIGGVESSTTGDRFSFILNADPYSKTAFQQIPTLRRRVKQAGGDTTLIGGATAEESDVRVFALRDERVVIPIVLILVFAILVLLLRSLVAPVVLSVTVILSFGAALGTGTFVSQRILGFAGMDASLPLITFVFLVAGGVDYIIFLMTRAREEAQHYGTKLGMTRALAMTGSVITSAGIVSAGTFGALAILPLALLIEFGFVLAFGVLLDTFLVRSILVPALVQDLGAKVWFPSPLSKRE